MYPTHSVCNNSVLLHRSNLPSTVIQVSACQTRCKKRYVAFHATGRHRFRIVIRHRACYRGIPIAPDNTEYRSIPYT